MEFKDFKYGDRVVVVCLEPEDEHETNIQVGDSGTVVGSDGDEVLDMRCCYVKLDKALPNDRPISNLNADGAYVFFGAQLALLEDEYDDEPADASQLKASFDSMFE